MHGRQSDQCLSQSLQLNSVDGARSQHAFLLPEVFEVHTVRIRHIEHHFCRCKCPVYMELPFIICDLFFIVVLGAIKTVPYTEIRAYMPFQLSSPKCSRANNLFVCRYFAQLITAYSGLQRFTVRKHPDAVAMAFSALSPDRNVSMAGRPCNVCQ